MTQHFLTPKTPERADVIMVGYDGPLSTFFAQVYKQTDDEPVWVPWEGCTPGQLLYAYEVLDLVGDHAYIPDGLCDALDDDLEAGQRGSQEASAVTRWSATGRAEAEPQADTRGEDHSVDG